jgi:anti-anti-sigma regulatory factor
MQKVGDNIRLDREKDVSILFIKNNLSYQTADELKIAEKQIRGKEVLIDLGQVKLTTSRGMASLISLILDAYDRNQKVAICNVSQMCMNIIDAMDLIKHVPNLKIFDDLDEGLVYFQHAKEHK